MKIVANSLEEFKEKVLNKEIELQVKLGVKKNDNKPERKVIKKKPKKIRKVQKQEDIAQRKKAKLNPDKGILPKHLQNILNVKIKKPKISPERLVDKLIVNTPTNLNTPLRLIDKYPNVLHSKGARKSDTELLQNVLWENVIFEENAISILIDNKRTNSIRNPFIRKSFNYLKTFLIVNNIEKFAVKHKGNVLLAVVNMNGFKDYVKNEVVLADLEVSERRYNNLFENYFRDLKKLSVTSLISKYKIQERSVFLDELCKLHCVDYPIIPVIEPRVSNGNVVSLQDTFLFTLKKKNNLFLVWESVIERNATFIFKIEKEDYNLVVQKVFTLIIREEPKRNELKMNSYHYRELGRIETLNHTSLEKWLNEIQKKTML